VTVPHAPRTGLLLFAHGARDPAWAQPFDSVVAELRHTRPDHPVRLAFLELMQPDLRTATAELVADGCRRLEVVPLFLGAGGHVRRDIPPLMSALRAEHPGIELVLHPAIGERPELIAAIVRITASLLPP
jgi:sirohydrochlorin cobaltochelatase